MDERTELERLRKMKRLRELEAKTGNTPMRAAPGSEPLPSIKENGLSSIGNIGKAFLMGGPQMGLISAAGEGVKGMGKVLDRAAYKVGEGATDLANSLGASPEIAGGAGYLANVGTQAIPVLTGALLGKATEPAFQSAGQRVMHSALKPLSKDVVSGDADRAIQTLLDEGINVSPRGADELSGIADDMNAQVQSLLRTSSGEVTKKYPAQEITNTYNRFRTQVNPESDIGAIQDAWNEFGRYVKNKIPVQQAQALKQGTYNALEGKYGEVGSASTEAQKALARGLRRAIEDIEPGVKPLNKRAGDVLNALRQVERRSGIAANRDIAGIAPAAMNPKAMAAMLADRSEVIKSLLARLLYSGGGAMGTGAGAAAGGALGYAQGQPP